MKSSPRRGTRLPNGAGKRRTTISRFRFRFKIQSHSQLFLAQNPLQVYRTEQPKLKATIHEQSKKIANLEARVAHLERDLATAINKLAMAKDDGCSTKTKDKKENGKLQNRIHRQSTKKCNI